jgi:hypothetical protein
MTTMRDLNIVTFKLLSFAEKTGGFILKFRIDYV